MIGIMYFIDKEGKEKEISVQGMRYDESSEEYLKRSGIDFEKVIAFNEEG